MKLKAPRGQVLPLVAISLIVLLGAAGFAVDVGYHQYRQRIQQTATDSAALAGAKELLTLNYVKAAQQDAANNGYTDTTNGGTCTPAKVCVQVSNPPVAPDAFATSPNANEAVEVIIRAPNATFFERLFGFNSVQISTKAVAMLIDEPNGNGCLYVLSGQANFNGQTGGGQVNADGCGLSFNEGANFHAATVDAARPRSRTARGARCRNQLRGRVHERNVHERTADRHIAGQRPVPGDCELRLFGKPSPDVQFTCYASGHRLQWQCSVHARLLQRKLKLQ